MVSAPLIGTHLPSDPPSFRCASRSLSLGKRFGDKCTSLIPVQFRAKSQLSLTTTPMCNTTSSTIFGSSIVTRPILAFGILLAVRLCYVDSRCTPIAQTDLALVHQQGRCSILAVSRKISDNLTRGTTASRATDSAVNWKETFQSTPRTRSFSYLRTIFFEFPIYRRKKA